MSISIEKKLEIQEKITERLTKEKEELEKQLKSVEKKAEETVSRYEKMYEDMLKAKTEYETMIIELNVLRDDFHKYYGTMKILNEDVPYLK